MNSTFRRRGLAGIALLGAAGVVLVGCAPAPEEGDGGSAEGSDFLACAVSDEGSWNDNSFNEAAYAGLTQAEDELGIEINDAESNSTEDFAPNLQTMIDAGCDITFGVGFNLIDAINSAASENPDYQFVTIDGYVADEATTNLKPVTYSMEQSSYLAGYLSASYSTSKVLGTYGGLQIPAVTSFMDGFYAGAQAWAEENGTPVTVVGWDPSTGTGDFVGNFADSAVATSITEGQLAQGADVFFPVAGGLFSATIEAIQTASAPAVVLGVDQNVAVTSPQYADIILTSVEKRMTAAVYDIIDTTMTDGFDASAYVGTLENDGTGLSEYGAFAEVSDETQARIDEITAQIIAGEIEIPITSY